MLDIVFLLYVLAVILDLLRSLVSILLDSVLDEQAPIFEPSIFARSRQCFPSL